MLKLGVIDVLNVLPVYYCINSNRIKVPAEIVKGKITDLNRQLNEGSIDISVVSSFEYAQHAEQYYVFPSLSIGANGPVQSIYLFLDQPLEHLTQSVIRLTQHSLTSVHLIQYILKDCDIEYTTDLNRSVNGELLIADEAIRRFYRKDYRHCYDLSALWKSITGLPFVFALWCVRKDTFNKNPGTVKKIHTALIQSKNLSNTFLEQMSKEHFQGVFPNQTECFQYLSNLHYGLTLPFQSGYALFQEKMVEIGKLTKISPLEFIPAT